MGIPHYHYDNYSIIDAYTYSIWANDILGNAGISAVHQFEIISGSVIMVDIPLTTGWNLITIPFENSYLASTLGENIADCTQISYWNKSAVKYGD